MNAEAQRKIAAILQVLDEAERPLGSQKIARALQTLGFDLEARMVRNYLNMMDAEGLTVNLGRGGRELTPRGRLELNDAGLMGRVGFIDARSDELAFKMTLDLRRQRGTVIMNLSTLPAAYLGDAQRIMAGVIRAGLGMGRFGLIGRQAAEGVPGLSLAAGEAVIGTVCSITVNGLLRAEGIPTISRFGGLLEIADKQPVRFTHVIRYDGTTLDPIEVFIKASMTRVGEAAATGNGIIGASFREVPAVALPQVRKVFERMDEAGLGGLILVGDPSRPLCGVPVEHGRAGIIIAAGLNPLAAVEEAGIPTTNRALARLCDFDRLVSLI